jgi:hypothetical protein
MFQGGASPDYFNQCSTYCPGVCVPENEFGYQLARSGSGYAGVYLFIGNYREYIETPLQSPLVAGTCYYFEMYVSLANYNSTETTDDIGVYFSDTAVAGIHYVHNLYFTPQINNINGNLFDTLNWKLVSGCYTATGNENFITIGNFKPDSTTTIIFTGNGNSPIYAYIDDVSLTPCSTPCITNIEEENQNEVIKIYPNPATDFITVSFPSAAEKNVSVEIFDLLGREVYNNILRTPNSRLQTKMDIADIKNGVYIFELSSENNFYRTKIVKM